MQRFSVPDKTPRYLSADEIEHLFLHMTQRFKPFFTALLYTGMRKDELTNLHWSDISNGQILVRPKSDWSPKSRSSIRSIPIHAQVKLALEDRRALAESKIFVFSTKSGHKLGKNLLRNQLLRYARDAGIQDVTVHTFRHTFASHLVQAGVSLYFVKDLLGHSSIKQTEIYAHLAPAPNAAILDNNLTFRI